jgi:glycolate oxidase iron-sulfur subunit
MKTEFSLAQLANPDFAEANNILRACVHCGFCNATCPTFLETGDELEGPRGRIYLMKSLLETGEAPAPETVRHIDNCLSCLSCMTTCPSGVDYRRLVDQTRVSIEKDFDRSLPDAVRRKSLNWLLPRPSLFRLALRFASFGRALKPLLPKGVQDWLDHAPGTLPRASKAERPQIHRAQGKTTRRVLLHTGCAQKVVRPAINEAAIRLLSRHGCEVHIAKGAGCCGALSHHLGEEPSAVRMAKRNITALLAELEGGTFDAIISTATGCSPTLKDYPHLLRHDDEWAEKAARVSDLCMDISEFYPRIELKASEGEHRLKVAYHTPCSLTHSLKSQDLPRAALVEVGFEVQDIAENHICCGSAGSYSLLQGEMSKSLLQRKVSQVEKISPHVIATSNIGCLTQLAGGLSAPVVHVVELLDWATGGPKSLGIDL